MNRRSYALLFAALALSPCLGAGLARAQDMSTLLSHQAPIESDGSGLVRLPLTPEVLALAAPDLSDVRIETRYATYLPFVVDREDHPRETLVEEAEVVLAPTSANQTRARGPVAPIFREVYVVSLPGDRASRATTLELSTEVPEFTATVRVTGPRVEVVTTVFRVARLGVARLAIPLPPAATGALTITLENETGYLSPRFVSRVREFETVVPRLTRPLEIATSRMEGTTQVLELVRPAGLIPLNLRIGTTSTTFAASVTVEARSADAGVATMGTGNVYRIPSRERGRPESLNPPPAEIIPGAEQLSIPVSGWLPGDRIVVRIERGDSPPLEALDITAELCEVALVFESEPDLTLRFGGARLAAPHYDLAMIGPALRNPTLPRASLGQVTENPRYQHDPVLAAAMRAGAEVDRSTFRVAASVTLPESREGLTRIEVSPAFAAAARLDGADVRVVSEDGRQWPYLLSGDVRTVPIEVPVRRVDALRSGTSRYELALPFTPFLITRLDVNPSEAFFGRSFEVTGLVEGSEEVLYAGDLYGERASGATAPVTVWTSSSPFRSLFLVIEDGSEAPLTFDQVTAYVTVTDLLVTAPAGNYEVLAGDALATAPTYDLGRVSADLLRNVALETVALGEVRPNPAYHVPTFFERSGWQTVVLWAVLVISVIGLLGLTLRLARSPQTEGVPASGAPVPAAESPTKSESPAKAESVESPAKVESRAKPESPAKPEEAKPETPEDGNA